MHFAMDGRLQIGAGDGVDAIGHVVGEIVGACVLRDELAIAAGRPKAGDDDAAAMTGHGDDGLGQHRFVLIIAREEQPRFEFNAKHLLRFDQQGRQLTLHLRGHASAPYAGC